MLFKLLTEGEQRQSHVTLYFFLSIF